MSAQDNEKKEEKASKEIALLAHKFDAFSSIKEGETICTYDLTIVQRGTWWATLKRTWCWESQPKLVAYVGNIVEEYKKVINECKNVEDRTNLIQKQASAMLGFNNLAASYIKEKDTYEALNKHIQELSQLYTQFNMKSSSSCGGESK